MTEKVNVMLTFRIEQEFVEEIKGVDPRIHLLYDPSLMGYPKYQSQHVGFTSGTPEQEKNGYK